MRLNVTPKLYAAEEEVHAGGECTMEVQVVSRLSHVNLG